ncbi:hypothetical protein YC2023_055257 [Brassica napus]|uniref:Secreted protein n=2 Tax=Brassica oleracea TaxID=3712 RepID=A0A0D3C3Z3_BRAOL|nr:unnamed protein product [Brassica oleracea]
MTMTFISYFMAIFSFQHMLLLVASLFFLPTFHAVDFKYCNGKCTLQENIKDSVEKNRRNFVGISLFRRNSDETRRRK